MTKLQHPLAINLPRQSAIGEHELTHWGMSTGYSHLGNNDNSDNIFNG